MTRRLTSCIPSNIPDTRRLSLAQDGCDLDDIENLIKSLVIFAVKCLEVVINNFSCTQGRFADYNIAEMHSFLKISQT